jgi:hypothetical protein
MQLQNLLRQALYYNFDYYHALGNGAFKNDDHILQLHVCKCYNLPLNSPTDELQPTVLISSDSSSCVRWTLEYLVRSGIIKQRQQHLSISIPSISVETSTLSGSGQKCASCPRKCPTTSCSPQNLGTPFIRRYLRLCWLLFTLPEHFLRVIGTAVAYENMCLNDR